jgi:phosphoserine phosphatase RsbU/P
MTSPRSDNIVIDTLYLSLFDGIDMGMYVLDAGNRLVYASPAFERVTGQAGDDLAGRPVADVFSPEDADDANELFNAAPGRTVRKDVAVTRNGAREAGYVAVNCRSEHGGAIHSVGIIGKSAAALADAESKIRMFTIAVEQSPATVVITDRDGNIEYVNPKFTRLTGYSLNEALGQNPRILKSGEQPAEFYEEMWKTISTGKEWRGEFHNMKKNGDSYWESASISPITDGAGRITHYIAIKEDITERKKAEEALRVSEEALRIKNNQIERDLQHAQAVVGTLLPTSPPKLKNLKVDFRFRPMDAIGGDFFSFNTLHDQGFGVFIGDVVGHGVSAALFLSLVRSFTERLNFTRGWEPGRYMKELNGDLTAWRVILFLTALYGYFDFSGNGTVFRFAKGGHTPPLLLDGATGTVRVLTSGGMPVGIAPESEFQEIEVAMKPGDRVFLYTDGLIEARDKTGIIVGTEGLESIIGATGGMDLGSSLDYILAEVARYSEGIYIDDDIVIIGLEVLT